MENENLINAKRIIAAASQAAARALGKCVEKPCSQAKYNAAARIALQDRAANLSQDDRRLIASFIMGDDLDPLISPLSIRLSAHQRADLENAADAVGMGLSEYVRAQLLAPPVAPHILRAFKNACLYARAGDLESVEKVLNYICLEIGVPYANNPQ